VGLRLLLVGTLALSVGCVHRATIRSVPSGAEVRVGKQVVGTTPVRLTRVVVPWVRIPVRVSMPGYRTFRFRLDRDIGPIRALGELLTLRVPRLLGLRDRRVHEIMLIRHHGAAGTWTPEEAGQ